MGYPLNKQQYVDPIECPVCRKVLGEWVEVKGKATIKKMCPRCKEMRYITKKG